MPAWLAGITSKGAFDNVQPFRGLLGPPHTSRGCVAVSREPFLAYERIPGVPIHIIDQPHQNNFVTRMQTRMTRNEIATALSIDIDFDLALFFGCVHKYFNVGG
jgi:hypothetical protein